MIKIDFSILLEEIGKNDEIYIGSKLYSSNLLLENIPQYIKQIHTSPLMGDFGRVTVKFFNSKLVVEKDTLFSQFRCHSQAIESLLKNEEYTYHCIEYYDYHYLTFILHFPNKGERLKYSKKTTPDGIRIRIFGPREYRDPYKDELYYFSSNTLKQEIILPKLEYMEKMIVCIKKYLDYRLLVETEEVQLNRFHTWYEEIRELEVKVEDYIKNYDQNDAV